MSKHAQECFGEIHLTLPNGREVVGRVPTLREQLQVMNLMEDVARGKFKARFKLVEWFPKLVGLQSELNELTIEEFFDVVNRFFGRRGSGNGKLEQTGEPPDLNDSSQSTPDTTESQPAPTCVGQSS